MSDYLQTDLLHFFDQHPRELELYQCLEERVKERITFSTIKIQKSQITYANRHNFAFASLPVRRKKDWPKNCLVVSFGLSCQLMSPRIAVAVEPYPNRWTHHVLITEEEQIDTELLDWIEAAFLFSEAKR